MSMHYSPVSKNCVNRCTTSQPLRLSKAACKAWPAHQATDAPSSPTAEEPSYAIGNFASTLLSGLLAITPAAQAAQSANIGPEATLPASVPLRAPFVAASGGIAWQASPAPLLLSTLPLGDPFNGLVVRSALDAATTTAPPLPPLPTAFPPLRPLALPAFREYTLLNGLRVFLLEDHEVPLVRGSLLMAGGQYASPSDKLGLATLSAALQRAGGSVQHPKDALDDRLEDLAAGIEAGAGSQVRRKATFITNTCRSTTVTIAVFYLFYRRFVRNQCGSLACRLFVST